MLILLHFASDLLHLIKVRFQPRPVFVSIFEGPDSKCDNDKNNDKASFAHRTLKLFTAASVFASTFISHELINSL